MPEAFQKGWQYYTKATFAGMAAKAGQDYCIKVEQSIENFTNEIISFISMVPTDNDMINYLKR